MTIETKYNIGDEVWFASGGKEIEGYIEYLRINYECGRWEEGKVETYTVRGFNDILYGNVGQELVDLLFDAILKLKEKGVI